MGEERNESEGEEKKNKNEGQRREEKGSWSKRGVSWSRLSKRVISMRPPCVHAEERVVEAGLGLFCVRAQICERLKHSSQKIAENMHTNTRQNGNRGWAVLVIGCERPGLARTVYKTVSQE